MKNNLRLSLERQSTQWNLTYTSYIHCEIFGWRNEVLLHTQSKIIFSDVLFFFCKKSVQWFNNIFYLSPNWTFIPHPERIYFPNISHSSEFKQYKLILIYSHCQHQDIFMLLSFAERSKILCCSIIHKDCNLDMNRVYAVYCNHMLYIFY